MLNSNFQKFEIFNFQKYEIFNFPKIRDFQFFLAAHCSRKSWVGDGKCDDLINMDLCEYDGGDCCMAIVDALYCDVCKCHSDLKKHPTLEPPFGQITTEQTSIPPTSQGPNDYQFGFSGK